MGHEAQVLQVEDEFQEDAIALNVLLKYCGYRANNNVEVEANLEVVVELVDEAKHKVEVVVQVHVES